MSDEKKTMTDTEILTAKLEALKAAGVDVDAVPLSVLSKRFEALEDDVDKLYEWFKREQPPPNAEWKARMILQHERSHLMHAVGCVMNRDAMLGLKAVSAYDQAVEAKHLVSIVDKVLAG